MTQGTVNTVKGKSSQFLSYKATGVLQQCAQQPFDLTATSALTPERIDQFSLSGAGYHLLYGTERVDEKTISALCDLATEAQAIKKMEQMQAGEVLNTIAGHESENRPVLHTAVRDLFGDKNTAPAAQKAAATTQTQIDRLEAFNTEVFGKERFTDMITVGIGGSDLGPQALYRGLQRFGKLTRRVHFVSNVDPDDVSRVLTHVDLSKTLVVVISKSGTTLETLTNEELIRSRFTRAGLDPKEHFVAVTREGSPMDDGSRYLQTFHMWDYVGGRYSATSMVGGVMLTFGLGFQVFKQILEGAHEMDRHALTSDPRKNLPLMSALLGIWNRDFLGFPTVAVIPYSQALSRFPAHLQQLDMESNGKQIDKTGHRVDFETGPVVWGEPGTNGQHSFFQLIHQGTSVVPVEFIGYKNSQWGEDIAVQGTSSQQKLLANLFAQALALAQGKGSDNPNRNFPGNRPSRLLIGQRLTPHAMGALLSYYEHKTAFQGFIWNINSFDQEGVQLGKVLASQLIDLQAGRLDAEKAPCAAALLKQIESL